MEYVPIQMTPSAQFLLQRIEPVLPLLLPRVFTEAVFQEEECSAGLENSEDFGHGLPDSGNAAKGEGTDNGIKTVFRPGQIFSRYETGMKSHRSLIHPYLSQSKHLRMIIHCSQSADLDWIMRKIVSCSKT